MSTTTGPVVLVMIDGLRPEALAQAHLPNLTALQARGAASLNASSVMPSVTLPCHTSIFHSVPPTRHGITSNDWQPMARPLPGLIDVAKLANLQCASIYNWEPLRNLSRPLSLHFSLCRDCSYDADGDDWVADEAVRYFTTQSPHFAFVYFGTVDTAGHAHGWLSEKYLQQAERVDQQLGRVLAVLPASATILVQADHGGHDRGHGTEMPEDMTIPWIIAGPSIRQGYEITGKVSLLETAPTLARVLGLTPHRDWEGRCVDEVFVE